ncbi:histidine kinase [Kribbella sp. NBC_00709]|uniref:sensor histidine kinase n=1 Tax=Kribbella sp. NBC_00709 TaxID=2975972 RepID=UPI002E2B7F51|nr:histidine kinase [Kribbella sp. NBC_00709]
MGVVSRWCRDLGIPPVAADCLLAGVILALNLVLLGQRHPGQVAVTVSGVVLCTAAAVGMVFRRRAPLLSLGLTTAAGVCYAITQQAKSPIGLFMACAAYMVVLRTDHRTRGTSIISVVAVTLVATAVFTNGELLANLFNGVVVLFGAAIGEATRYRRAYVQELEERALRAEQSRDEEAQRRVIEERLRIAHELHDVIAHHIALMNVQSGVAAHVLRTQPDEAEHALALVRSGGRTVLQELTVLLGVLRRSGSPLPTAPAPSLQELGALVDSFTAAGVKVDWSPPDSIGDLPDVIELTAYRIVQESLTNVLKHAPGAPAEVRLTRTSSALTIAIHNPAPSTSAGDHRSGGHGLVGMRERVAAVGGTLSAGPMADGGFAVHAVLPLETGGVGGDSGVAGGRSDLDPEWVSGAGEFSAGSAGRS